MELALSLSLTRARGAGASASASAELLTLATAAGAEAVYNPDDENTWTLRDDGSDLWYSAIADGLGNREDMVQGTAANQLKQITLSTGRRAMLAEPADGMLADFASDISQPNTVVIIRRLVGIPGGSESGRFLDSLNTTGRQVVGAAGGASGNSGWRIWAGSFISSLAPALDTDWHFHHGNYNTTSSELLQDGTSIATGDVGTNGLGGVEIPHSGDLATITVDREFGPIIVFTGLKTNAELSDIRDHINANWPIGSAA